MQMGFYFPNRVRHAELSATNALYPLFEAISNSIHAIEDTQRQDGEIRIVVKRVPQQELLKAEKPQIPPVHGFEISDNGIGFDERNFNSFLTADSPHKAERGGKGIGRILWLKVFQNVNVVSVYEGQSGFRQRSFVFSIHTDPIQEHQDAETSDSRSGTVVSLLGVRPPFSRYIPKELDTLASRIIEHYLQSFVLGKMPSIALFDEDNNAVVNLQTEYKNLVSASVAGQFVIGKTRFDVNHFLLRSSVADHHRLHLCAIDRVVTQYRLDGQVSNLPSTIEKEGESQRLVYAGYVSGDYLNEIVNPERTNFRAIEGVAFEFPDEIPMDEIRQQAVETAKVFLEPHTQPVGQKKCSDIESYIINEAPGYRHILENYPERLDSIPPEATRDKQRLDNHLHSLKREIEVELRHQSDELVRDIRNTPESASQDYQSRVTRELRKFLERWNSFSRDELAQYIIHRKIILSLLTETLQRQPSGKFEREEAIHKMIFPMRTTSNDVRYEDHNLWLVDERLAFHRYLTSDLPFKQIELGGSESRDRPDILIADPSSIFEQPIAISEGESPYNSIVILEFKRPRRNDYVDSTHKHDPIEQLSDYVDELKANRHEDAFGRPIRVTDATRFYCYLLCDLESRLEKQFEHRGFTKSPDSEGYFWVNPKTQVYFEVISYSKVLKDAKQRNRVLFEKLNLPVDF